MSRRHVPTRFLINQCQIITFLILKSDNIENSRIELKHLLLFYPSTWYICHFFLFHIEIEGKCGWIIGGGGGGAKGMLAPSLKLLGGGGAGPLPPPPPTPMQTFYGQVLVLFRSTGCPVCLSLLSCFIVTGLRSVRLINTFSLALRSGPVVQN